MSRIKSRGTPSRKFATSAVGPIPAKVGVPGRPGSISNRTVPSAPRSTSQSASPGSLSKSTRSDVIAYVAEASRTSPVWKNPSVRCVA